MNKSLLEIAHEISFSMDTSGNDIIKEFFVPCLQRATSYDVGVGYFTSGWIKLASKGLAAFIENGGHSRWIINPDLPEEDWEAIKTGTELSSQEIISNRMQQNLIELEEALESDTRNMLSWLIAEGRLEFKIAIPTNSLSGIWHPKFGVIKDTEENTIAFDGSYNMTIQANLNWEKINIYRSWVPEDKFRLNRQVDDFDKIWMTKDNNVKVFDVHENVIKHIIDKWRANRPHYFPILKYIQPLETNDTNDIYDQIINGNLYHNDEFRPPDSLILYDHQIQAIEAWNATEGKNAHAKRCGFLEMATGSGKTITALYLASALYKSLKSLAIIIVVPTKVLVDQWAEEACKFGLDPIKGSSNDPNWKKVAWSNIRAFSRKHIDHFIIITTNRSFSTQEFQRMVDALNNPILLIADEAHNLGSANSLNYLPPVIEYRLALSATPERYFDSEGTEQLFRYFGETVYRFSLSDAIGTCLTPYDYFIIPVELTDDEIEEYRKISIQISKISAIKRDEKGNDTQINNLFIKRARITSNAYNKVKVFTDTFDKIKFDSMKHIFVYTSDKDPNQTNQITNILQREKHLLVHQFTEKESGDNNLRKELINRFTVGEDLQVLVAKRCLDEGIDIPPTRYGFFLASTSNPRQYIQRRGRLLRKSHGKTHATIFDFFVIPPNEPGIINDLDVSIIKSELRRIIEFASLARNEASAKVSILEIAKRYGVLDILESGGTI